MHFHPGFFADGNSQLRLAESIYHLQIKKKYPQKEHISPPNKEKISQREACILQIKKNIPKRSIYLPNQEHIPKGSRSPPNKEKNIPKRNRSPPNKKSFLDVIFSISKPSLGSIVAVSSTCNQSNGQEGEIFVSRATI